MKALSLKDPDHGHFPSPGGRSMLPEEIGRKDPVIRPPANINVAAILEKANAIRQVLQHLLGLSFAHGPFLILHHC